MYSIPATNYAILTLLPGAMPEFVARLGKTRGIAA